MTTISKLRAKDGKILKVSQDVIKQMVTIQTMLDCPGVENNNDDDDEPIPIFAVNLMVKFFTNLSNGQNITLRTMTILLITKFGTISFSWTISVKFLF